MRAEAGRARVLVLLASNQRRGAEIEGATLARELDGRALRVDVAALAPSAAAGGTLDVPVCGGAPLAPATLLALRRLAAGYGVVVAFGSSTLPACAIALLGSPTRFCYRSIGDPAAWVRGPLHRERTGLLMRRAALVVPLWDAAAATVRRLYRVEPSRVVAVPNARSPEGFQPPTGAEREAARRAFGLEGPGRVVAVIGALTHVKRVGLAIAAAAVMSDCRLLVVGDGPERDALERQAAGALGGRAVFTGALRDVRPALHAADALALPSATEGMPGSVLEAGLTGLPVAACDVGAVGWLFANGVAGALCDPRCDPPAFALALQRALQAGGGDPAALARVCGWEPVRTRWTDLLRGLLARDRREGAAA